MTEKHIDIGEWGVVIETGELFRVVDIGEYPMPTGYSELCYIDEDNEGHIIYHCRPATKEEIKKSGYEHRPNI